MTARLREGLPEGERPLTKPSCGENEEEESTRRAAVFVGERKARRRKGRLAAVTAVPRKAGLFIFPLVLIIPHSGVAYARDDGIAYYHIDLS